MSSHARGYGLPNVGVDGSRFFDHYYYCVQSEFLLDIDPVPWFRVDLQGRFHISYISVTSAAFCCGSLSSGSAKPISSLLHTDLSLSLIHI